MIFLFFRILKDEEILIDDLAKELYSRGNPTCDMLCLDGVEMRITDENIFTESIVFHRLGTEENLECLGETLYEFCDHNCYVIEWHYRIEREGIRRLNGAPITVHDTGRQRVAYFYWLGRNSGIKDQSRCKILDFV